MRSFAWVVTLGVLLALLLLLMWVDVLAFTLSVPDSAPD